MKEKLGQYALCMTQFKDQANYGILLMKLLYLTKGGERSDPMGSAESQL